jgi:hypothetical protein
MHVPQSWLVLSIVGVASRLQPSAAQIKFRTAVSAAAWTRCCCADAA